MPPFGTELSCRSRNASSQKPGLTGADAWYGGGGSSEDEGVVFKVASVAFSDIVAVM